MALVALSNVMNATEVSRFTYNSKNGLFNYTNPKSGNTHPVNERYVAKHLTPEMINYLKSDLQRTTAVEFDQAVKILAQKNKVAQDLSQGAANFLTSQDKFAQTVKASKTAEFFNMQRQAQNLLSLQPKPTALTVVVPEQASKIAINPKRDVAGFKSAAQATQALTTSANKYAIAYMAATAAIPVIATGILGNQYFTNKQVQPTKMQRVKNALNSAGSLVKSNVQAHPRIATGAGLVTLAGLSYAAYNKFGKAVKKSTVNVSTPVVKTEAKTVTPVVAPVKKAKTVKRLPGGYARRK